MVNREAATAWRSFLFSDYPFAIPERKIRDFVINLPETVATGKNRFLQSPSLKIGKFCLLQSESLPIGKFCLLQSPGLKIGKFCLLHELLDLHRI